MSVQEQKSRQREELRGLSLDEALAIAARHGIVVRVKPLIVLSYVTATGRRVARLYLPHYIVHIEVDRGGREQARIERAQYCNCDCGEGGILA